MPELWIDDFSQVPRIQPIHLFSTHHSMQSLSIEVDRAGKLFVCVQINLMGSNDSLAYVRMYDNQLNFMDHRAFPLPYDDKHDGVALSHSGSDLLVGGVGHDTPNPPTPQRRSPCGIGRWVGVWDPFNPGEVPEGGASVWGTIQEVDVTPEEVVDAFAAALGDAGHPLTRGYARASQEGTRKAIVSPEVDPFVVDEGELNARMQQAFTGGGDFYTGHGVYARFTETTYEQVRKLLVEAGLLPPPPPPQPKKEG